MNKACVLWISCVKSLGEAKEKEMNSPNHFIMSQTWFKIV